MCAGLARNIYIYTGVNTVFLAGKSPNIRSCLVHIYGSGQPYILYMNYVCCVVVGVGVGVGGWVNGCV
jgi:hypothetical protein